MNIKLIPSKKNNKFIFPSLPSEFSLANSTRYQEHSTLAGMTASQPIGSEIVSISWSGVFFGKTRKKEAFVKKANYSNPKKCVKKLQKWQRNGTILNLVITDTWVNMDVTISDFTVSPFGAFGDISYNITLKKYRPLNVYTTKDLKINNKKKLQKLVLGNRRNKSISNSYKIKYGDTLWVIAVYCYGNGKYWTRLWKANKKLLDKKAKKAGYKNSKGGKILVPNTKIKVPR